MEKEEERRKTEQGNLESVGDETPRLSYRCSFSGAGGRVPSEPAEPAGMKTPPLHVPVSVPYAWEEVPGKPRPFFSFATVLPLHLPPSDDHPLNPPSMTLPPSSSHPVAQRLFLRESVEEALVSAGNKKTAERMMNGKKRPRDALLHLQISGITRLLEKMCMAPKRRRTV
ncbi:uncharacterized protein LOC116251119 [Nymphaea colorata]|nr:uncharacterized protein LOC116251119 [Nymphaea colorata]